MRKVTYKKTCLPGLLWLAFVLFPTSFASGQQRFQTGSWGDQGDGTYRNPVFTIAFGKWTGDRLGFFCWNEKEEKGHIDVDWFKYDYDGPKALTKH